MVASHMPPTGDLVSNPGMCPDWESNHIPFSLQAGTQSTEPHQPGLLMLAFISTEAYGMYSLYLPVLSVESLLCLFLAGNSRLVFLIAVSYSVA